MEPQLLALLSLTALLSLAGGFVLSRLEAARRAEAPREAPSSSLAPRPPDHVHTYRRTSSEKTGGMVVATYRCDECGNLERWEVQQA